MASSWEETIFLFGYPLSRLQNLLPNFGTLLGDAIQNSVPSNSTAFFTTVRNRAAWLRSGCHDAACYIRNVTKNPAALQLPASGRKWRSRACRGPLE